MEERTGRGYDGLSRPAVFYGAGAIQVGRWSYWNDDTRLVAWKHQDSIDVGKFCALASGVRLLAGGNHPLDSICSYPLALMKTPPSPPGEFLEGEHIVIGNEVWIGTNAIVIGNVNIGSGAVVGAGSVVVRDIPPYAVAVGSPARPVRFRFSSEEIDRLLHLSWWDWPDDLVLSAAPLLETGDIDRLEELASVHKLQAKAAPQP